MPLMSLTPGPKVRMPAEFLDELETVLGGEDRWRAARSSVRDRFHRFPDGHSSERVAAKMRG
jgi:CDP-glycerol glycerophosphotransferase (TagB/SpsB family)